MLFTLIQASLFSSK